MRNYLGYVYFLTMSTVSQNNNTFESLRNHSFVTMSFHLFDPQKSVRFVKASETNVDSQKDETNKLNGDEIREFYEFVCNQPSTSRSIQMTG